ncbi:MAG: hypothetical protein GX095_05600 [Clostridiales bacterium]|nr:hypothetical protein [Clostridiales bacterium]
MNKKLPVIILLLTVSALIAFTFAACIPKGSIIILEDRDGKGVLAELKEYDKVDKWELPLSKGDEVRVEVEHVEGIIGLTVSGKKGSEPYNGSKLEPGAFTFTVEESDTYVFILRGSKATGKITVRNLGQQ